MNRSLFSFCFLLIGVASGLYAQSTSVVTGLVVDSASREPMNGATVTIHDEAGKALTGAICGSRGRYIIKAVEPGSYLLSARFVAYETFAKKIRVPQGDTLVVGRIRLVQSSSTSAEIEVNAVASRMEVRGDTVDYNASAFKTDKNAAAEDLVRKMPGIEVENGQVKAHGEQVKRVLVDGKPFFGDDPAATLKNLPSEIIDRVQVYDQMSDQSQFTRFDDGERNKTLNIITKPDKRNGQFGKMYAGYGTDSRYTAGGNINLFNGDRRFSVLLLSNNINQQNFSIQDILGATGGNNMFTQMAGNAMRMFGGGTGGRGQMQFSRGGGGGSSDFQVSQGDGITSSHGLGLNYTDSWGKDFNLTASYFVNKSDNISDQDLFRQTFIENSANQNFTQSSKNNSSNVNHRLNLRADYSMDSMSSILFTPRFTWQSNDRNNATDGSTAADTSLLNRSLTATNTDKSGYNLGSELLYRLRFATEGRTLSLNLKGNRRTSNGDQTTTADNDFFAMDTILTRNIDQILPSTGLESSYGGSLNYTEPIHKDGQVQLSYNYNFSRNGSDKKAYGYDSTEKAYSQLDPRLSNIANTVYETHRPGLNYKLTLASSPDTASSGLMGMFGMMGGGMGRGGGGGGMMRGMRDAMGSVGAWTFNFGVDYQLARLTLDQTFPSVLAGEKRFYNLLPSFSVNTRPTMFSNFRVSYRTGTTQPEIQQLQNVVDNSDPLKLSIGNSDLRQEFTHNFFINYGVFNVASASGLYAMISGRVVQDRIVTATTIVDAPTIVGDSIRLGPGVQFSKPENRNGFWSANSFLVYSFPFEPVRGLKLNANINAGVVYTHDIGVINTQINNVGSWVVTPAIGLSTNIGENTDFSLSARSAYNSVRNSIRPELDQTFYIHTVTGRYSLVLAEVILLTGDYSNVITTGLSESFNRSVQLLNLGAGVRLFDGRAEVKLSVFDVLNKNNSFTRNVGTGYLEDVRTTVLQRYGLLNITYYLRAF